MYKKIDKTFEELIKDSKRLHKAFLNQTGDHNIIKCRETLKEMKKTIKMMDTHLNNYDILTMPMREVGDFRELY